MVLRLGLPEDVPVSADVEQTRQVSQRHQETPVQLLR